MLRGLTQMLSIRQRQLYCAMGSKAGGLEALASLLFDDVGEEKPGTWYRYIHCLQNVMMKSSKTSYSRHCCS